MSLSLSHTESIIFLKLEENFTLRDCMDGPGEHMQVK